MVKVHCLGRGFWAELTAMRIDGPPTSTGLTERQSSSTRLDFLERSKQVWSSLGVEPWKSPQPEFVDQYLHIKAALAADEHIRHLFEFPFSGGISLRGGDNQGPLGCGSEEGHARVNAEASGDHGECRPGALAVVLAP